MLAGVGQHDARRARCCRPARGGWPRRRSRSAPCRAARRGDHPERALPVEEEAEVVLQERRPVAGHGRRRRRAGPRRARSPSSASRRRRPRRVGHEEGAAPRRRRRPPGCGRSRSSKAGGFEAAPVDERVERRRHRHGAVGGGGGLRRAAQQQHRAELGRDEASPAPGNSVTGAAKKRGTKPEVAPRSSAKVGRARRGAPADRHHDRQLGLRCRRPAAGERRRRARSRSADSTSAGWPAKVTALASGSGRKPRPWSTTRSPTAPRRGLTSITSGSRPM